jgi:hypothetical protein
MTEPIRLCCDCKYYKKDWIARITGSGDIYDRCVHPIVTGNVVTGKSNGYYCDTTRRFHECGYEGKLWEARK